MLAYAANTPQVAVRRPSPKTLLLIAAAHVVVLGVIVTAKSDLPQRIMPTVTTVTLIHTPPPPPGHVVKPRVIQQPQHSAVTQPPPPIVLPQVPIANATPQLPNIDNVVGPGAQPSRREPQPAIAAPAPTPAWLLTPPSELRPPYPESKLLTGEEATLRLRLSIDEHGRVVAVDAIGPADRTFFDAARRYVMAHWRYSPATQAGQPVGTSLVVTLKFQLEG